MVAVVIRAEGADARSIAQPVELVAARERLKQPQHRQRQADAEKKARISAGGVRRDNDARHAPQHSRAGGPQDDGGPGLVRRRRERPQRVGIAGCYDGRELKAALGRDYRREKPEPGALGRRRDALSGRTASASRKAGPRSPPATTARRPKAMTPKAVSAYSSSLHCPGRDARHHEARSFWSPSRRSRGSTARSNVSSA